MLRLSNLALPLDYTEASLAAAVAKKCGLSPDQLLSCTVVRRSVDARKKDDVHFVLTVHFKTKNDFLIFIFFYSFLKPIFINKSIVLHSHGIMRRFIFAT